MPSLSWRIRGPKDSVVFPYGLHSVFIKYGGTTGFGHKRGWLSAVPYMSSPHGSSSPGGNTRASNKLHREKFNLGEE